MYRLQSGFALTFCFVFFMKMKMVQNAFGCYVLKMNDQFCINICAAECAAVSHNECTGFKPPC